MGINIEKEYIQRVANTNMLRVLGEIFPFFLSLTFLKSVFLLEYFFNVNLFF